MPDAVVLRKLAEDLAEAEGIPLTEAIRRLGAVLTSGGPPLRVTGPDRAALVANDNDAQEGTMTDETTAAPDSLLTDIAAVLNRHSRENASNTPDFILAGVMVAALTAFEQASNHRENWYGQSLADAGLVLVHIQELYDHADGNVGDGCYALYERYAESAKRREADHG